MDNAAEGTVFLHSYQELPHSKHRSQDNAGALLHCLAARRRLRLLQQVCELNQLGSYSEAKKGQDKIQPENRHRAKQLCWFVI